MSGMPFHFPGNGGLEFDIATLPAIWNQKEQQNHQQVNSFTSTEPTSVLHMRRSPSPPTSASTLSSSFNGGADNTEKADRKDEWATLQPIPTSLERCGLGLEDWENMLSEPNQEQSLLRWIAGDVDESFGLRQLLQAGGNPQDFDGNAGGGGGLGIVDHGPVFEGIAGIGVSNLGNFLPLSPSAELNHKNGGLGSNHNPIFGSPASNLPPGMMFHHIEEKPQILNPQMLMNQQQHSNVPNPNFFMPLQENHLLQPLQHHVQPQSKRHNSSGGMDTMPQMIPKLPFSDPGNELLLRKHHQQQQQQQQNPGVPHGVQFLNPHLHQVKKEEIGGHHQHQQQQQYQHALLDQLFKAAELIGTGNFSHAQGILARLNQQLSPIGKPLHRAAFYFKEALQLLLVTNTNPVSALPARSPTPFDVIFKMGAYKVFSEVSPLIQFVNFTCNQALLEALGDAERIHIVDFDIGFGAQWASFMQELPRNRGTPSLKITAFASPSTHHPVEVLLMRENLTQFANDNGISFELDVVNFDSLDQNCYSLPIFRSNENEAVAVNFPVWCSSSQPSSLPSLLRFVKQLSPKIVVSLDRGCDRTDLPFPQHILHALQSYIHLLESLDAVNVASDAVNKIEKFLLQPRIESTVLGRLNAPDKMPNWKTIFASAGFTPVTFSNFSETQAECVVKRTPVRGFHVEKRQASLVLCWQRRELISASAWRC
ncbi:GRAS family transcription factor [Euphorbia peplus]|nr:GRAS family transcription factor [Euphorbia peplus]